MHEKRNSGSIIISRSSGSKKTSTRVLAKPNNESLAKRSYTEGVTIFSPKTE